MKINEVIKTKRLEKGWTQEQVAMKLGVSASAVHKWEKGSSYPDITLLPALTRLLDTDLNTLLQFKESISDEEIAQYLNELSSQAKKEDFSVLYDQAMELIKEYPNSDRLKINLAQVLSGILLMNECTCKDKTFYETHILALYEEVIHSEDVQVKTQAQYMLTHTYINQKQYEKAEALMKDLPEQSYIDQKQIKAKLHKAYGEYDEAARLEEERLMNKVNEIQAILLSLMDIALATDRIEDAECIAEKSKQFVSNFDLWEYMQYIALFEYYSKTKQFMKSAKTFVRMMKSLNHPWQINTSPLYRYIKTKPQNPEFLSLLRKELCKSAENDQEMEELCEDPEVQKILRECH